MSVVLSEHLPLLASAPDGIQKLRGLILELAVRGKLVPQDPNDEPASELLKRIAQERARLEAEGVCKKSKAMPLIDEGEQPFEAPSGWQFVRLGVLLSKIGAGSTPLGGKQIYVSDGVKFLRSQNVWNDGLRLDDVARIPPAVHKKMSGTHIQAGDLLFNITGASIGRCAIVPDTFDAGNVSQHVTIIRLLSKDVLQFLHTVLISDLVQRTVMDVQVGVSREGLSIGKLAQFVIPLPPLAEQHRIVAKVDELMALCDRLEAEQTDAESAHAKLVDTLLGTLTQSADAAEFAANLQRLAEHFDTLFTTESSLDALKQTILQLAVMGKLVPQNPDDEPASELLKRVAKERARLEAAGTGKKSKPVRLASNGSQPNGWVSVVLPDLCEIGGGATPSKAKSAYWDEGLPWVSPKDMKVDLIFDAQDHVTELALRETRIPRVPIGSLLIVVRGMILAHSFPVATTQVDVTINQDMKSLTPLIPELQPFLALALRGWKPRILALVDRSTHGTCKLQSEKLFAFEFGIPPLAEQHRIVAKVDELMALCDRLKADLAESRSRQARLSATLIESALQAA